MIRTVAVVRLNPQAPADELAAFQAALAQLPGQVGTVRSFSFGADLGLRPGNRDFAVVADFASAEDFRIYNEHPAHQAIRDRWVGPLVGEAAVVQYELPDAIAD